MLTDPKKEACPEENQPQSWWSYSAPKGAGFENCASNCRTCLCSLGMWETRIGRKRN